MFLRRWQLWLGLLISGVLVWIAFASLDMSRVWQHVQSVQAGWLLPAFLAYFVTVGLRSWRWAYLLHPVQSITTRRLFPVVVIGYLANNIYPFRIGELLRAYLLQRRELVPLSSGLATIVVERVFDALAILSYVFIALPFVPVASESLRTGLLLASGAFVSLLLLFLILAVQVDRTMRMITRISNLLPGQRPGQVVSGFAGRFLSGLAVLQSGQAILVLYFFSLAIWYVEILKYWLVLRAFPLELGFSLLMLLNGVVNMATILPSAPGYVGTFDAPGIALLVLLDVSPGLAGAYMLVLHAILWLPSVLFGFLFMMGAGIGWSAFSTAADMETTELASDTGEQHH